MPHTAPYGSWKSPITADLIVSAVVGLGQIALDGDEVYWVEQRPTEGGRNVVVQRSPDGRIRDRTPAPFNARTRVHEYGGGACVVHRGSLYFSNFADQRVYRQQAGAAPEPITPDENLRYADGQVDPHRNRLVCVREDHRQADREAVNTIVALALDSGDSRVLVSGSDFYSSPRLSPDGSRLAWLSWNHPNMPWTAPNCGWPRFGPTGRWTLPGALPAAPPNPSSSPPGRRRRAVLRVRPNGLVECVSLAGRSGRSHVRQSGRVRPAPVGLWHVNVCVRFRRDHDLYLYRKRRLASGQPRYPHQTAGRTRHPVHRHLRHSCRVGPGRVQRRLADRGGLYRRA